MAERADTEAEIDRLYELPLGDFTAARDDLAARLRREGSSDAAAEVKRLRKPSVSAWALNQVRRGNPERVDELIEAGQRLREAQDAVLGGADREALDQASEDERRLVSELARHAERELVAADRGVSSAVQQRLRDTLHAAATDPEAREGLAAGRLVRDHTPGGAWPLAGAEQPARVRKAKASSEAQKAKQVRSRLERAKVKQEKLDREASEAGRNVREARAEAARAASRLERAEAAEDQARRRAEESRREVEELEAAARDGRARTSRSS
jgi:hypothetical protein